MAESEPQKGAISHQLCLAAAFASHQVWKPAPSSCLMNALMRTVANALRVLQHPPTARTRHHRKLGSWYTPLSQDAKALPQ
ncbi:hypothetical protein E5D57_000398 [Metarhizium anisopliae]|nr:hypothetical protein E5D57_000398 [Metarhizium anisopliae]